MTDEIFSDNTCLEPIPIDYKAAFFTLSKKVLLIKFLLEYAGKEPALRRAKEAVDFTDAVEKTANTFQIKANHSKRRTTNDQPTPIN